MFREVVVDGSTTCIPRQFSAHASEEQAAGGGTDTDGYENNSMSNFSRKRGSASTGTDGESPSKKAKTPLLKAVVNGIMAKFDQDSKVANENLAQFRSSKEARHMKKKEQKNAEIKRCMDLVKECGAEPGSDEHFVATTLFEKEYFRQIFMAIDTVQRRLVWLQKCVQKGT
jgi:hypothetical protein